MGKVSPKDRGLEAHKKNGQLKSSSSKYLKPGTLAQLRHGKVSAANLCTELGRKSVAVLGAKKPEDDNLVIRNKVIENIPLMLSPVDFHKQNTLVKILCHLHHDQLRAVFHVSRRIREAACLARQFHFNYRTPDRSRQEILSMMTPRPAQHWPFMSKGDGEGIFVGSPHIEKAPRHGPRPPSRVKVTELRQIAAVLFQDSGYLSRCMVPSVLPKPLCKPLASNRVLFYEDELCKAVAQNKLR